MSRGFKIPEIYTFGDLKARMQNIVVENDYFWFLLAADETMFEYKGLPEEIEENRLEDFLNITGGVVWQKKDGLHMVAPYAAREGEINQWGYGKYAHSETLNGISLYGEVGKDIAVMYNNTVRSPQTDLYTTADILTDIDCSSKVNVLFARVAPIFGVRNDKQKTAIRELIKKIISGEIETIISDSDKDINSIAGKDADIKSIEAITTPEKVQYIQYLSQYFDIRLRRHFMRRGLALKTSDKQAQVTNAEVHGLDAASWFYPLSKLKARQKGLEMINRINGTNITVGFSELWSQEYEAYKLRAAVEDKTEQSAHDQMKEGAENENISDENGVA